VAYVYISNLPETLFNMEKAYSLEGALMKAKPKTIIFIITIAILGLLIYLSPKQPYEPPTENPRAWIHLLLSAFD